MNEKQQKQYDESVARSERRKADREALAEVPEVREILELLNPRAFKFHEASLGAHNRDKALDLMVDLFKKVAKKKGGET